MHARTLADAGVEIAAVVTAPGRRRVRRRASRGGRARSWRPPARSASRASSSAHGRRQRDDRVRPARGRRRDPGQPPPAAPRPTTCPSSLAGECSLTEPGGSLDEAVESGKQAGIAAAARAAAVRARRRTRRRRPAARAATSASARTSTSRTSRSRSTRASTPPSCSSATRPSPWARARAGCAPSSCAPIAERVTPEEAERVGQPTTLRPPVRPLRARGGRGRRPPPHRAAHGPAPRSTSRPARRPCGPARGSASRRTTATSTASTGRCASASA